MGLIMISGFTLLKRRADLSVTEFQQYWRQEHAEIIAQLPGIHRYVQSHLLSESYLGMQPIYDGIAELWANDSQAFREIAASDAYLKVLADEENFLDRTATTFVLTEEHVIKDGSVIADHVKRIRLINRKPNLSVNEFQDYWRNSYGTALVDLPLLDRYVQYHARPGGYAHGRQPAYDGFDVTWFKSADALHHSLDSEIYRRALAQEKNFLAAGEDQQVLARDLVIID